MTKPIQKLAHTLPAVLTINHILFATEVARAEEKPLIETVDLQENDNQKFTNIIKIDNLLIFDANGYMGIVTCGKT